MSYTRNLLPTIIANVFFRSSNLFLETQWTKTDWFELELRNYYQRSLPLTRIMYLTKQKLDKIFTLDSLSRAKRFCTLYWHTHSDQQNGNLKSFHLTVDRSSSLRTSKNKKNSSEKKKEKRKKKKSIDMKNTWSGREEVLELGCVICRFAFVGEAFAASYGANRWHPLP